MGFDESNLSWWADLLPYMTPRSLFALSMVSKKARALVFSKADDTFWRTVVLNYLKDNEHYPDSLFSMKTTWIQKFKKYRPLILFNFDNDPTMKALNDIQKVRLSNIENIPFIEPIIWNDLTSLKKIHVALQQPSQAAVISAADFVSSYLPTATEYAAHDILNYLLSLGVPPEVDPATYNSYNRALQISIEHHDIKSTLALLNSGASPHARRYRTIIDSSYGPYLLNRHLSAMDLALHVKNQSAIEALIKRGIHFPELQFPQTSWLCSVKFMRFLLAHANAESLNLHLPYAIYLHDKSLIQDMLLVLQDNNVLSSTSLCRAIKALCDETGFIKDCNIFPCNHAWENERLPHESRLIFRKEVLHLLIDALIQNKSAEPRHYHQALYSIRYVEPTLGLKLEKVIQKDLVHYIERREKKIKTSQSCLSFFCGRKPDKKLEAAKSLLLNKADLHKETLSKGKLKKIYDEYRDRKSYRDLD